MIYPLQNCPNRDLRMSWPRILSSVALRQCCQSSAGEDCTLQQSWGGLPSSKSAATSSVAYKGHWSYVQLAQRVRTPSCWPPSHQPVSWWWVRRRIPLTIRFSDSRRHQPSSLISMPVASLPDLELVCAPRSSLSTQKYKPKVGGQITLLSPLAQILGGRVPPVPPWSTPLYTGQFK